MSHQQRHVIEAATDPRLYIEDARWLPCAFDIEARTLTFMYLPREAQRRAVFLDRRFVGAAARSDPAPIGALDRARIKQLSGPIHFIVHTGFCCSTLLTRALDRPGAAMGLKEPEVLASFGRPWINANRFTAAMSGLELILDLLSRPLQPGETQIIKPSNACNPIVPEMLHVRPDAKVLLMHASLGEFLAAIAKRGAGGRAFVRALHRDFASSMPLGVTLPPDEQMMLTDLQVAAQVWLMQMSLFRTIAEHHGLDRVRTLSSDAFVQQPERALERVHHFFGLSGGPDDWTEHTDRILCEHAKEHGRSFDARRRTSDIDEARAKHAAEIAAAEAWARHFAAHCRAPHWLGDTLLAV